MLGERTASVNEGVQKLEADGVIGHRGEEITVLDRDALEGVTCGCHTSTSFATGRIDPDDPMHVTVPHPCGRQK